MGVKLCHIEKHRLRVFDDSVLRRYLGQWAQGNRGVEKTT